MNPITTNILRASYEQGIFSFGNPEASTKVCLVGSCRIVPILNGLRAYNELAGGPFEFICLNPIEMWRGPGSDVADCANHVLKDYRLEGVDFLVCEHVLRCGVLNTVRESEQNIFDSLGCDPSVSVRLPNWNNMHLFDEETAGWDKSYAAMGHDERVAELRHRSDGHKRKFLLYCAGSSLPELAEWVESDWLTTRMGWSSNHPSLPLVWRLFNGVAGKLGITITPELAAHPLCATDTYQSTGIKLNQIDYEANNWKF